MRAASHERTSSRRHMRPLWGMCCSIQSWSSGMAHLELDACAIEIIEAYTPVCAVRELCEQGQAASRGDRAAQLLEGVILQAIGGRAAPAELDVWHGSRLASGREEQIYAEGVRN